jgi:predicted TIM-barrel fold metal-dependent hydrolase
VPNDPAAAAQLLEMLAGPGLLAYASDHPHEHGGDGIAPLLAQLSDDDVDAVLRRNAAELYGLSTAHAA